MADFVSRGKNRALSRRGAFFLTIMYTSLSASWKGEQAFMVKDEVLCALEQSRGTRLSGGQLARELGVSRTAIWKAIEALRAEGILVESSQGSGYCLLPEDDSLTAAGVSALLETETFGRDVLILAETGSTNTTIKEDYAASRAEGFTLIAHRQTAGRGRLGRGFSSPPGGGLYMSILLKPRLSLSKLNFITFAAAVAVCRAIKALCGFQPQIKWVNDVLMEDKKLCGILTEAAVEGETGAVDYAVLGIGINLRLDRQALPEDVRAVAGSLADFSEHVPRRAQLAASVLWELEQLYRVLNSGDTAPLFAEYRTLLCCLGKPVQVVTAADSYAAICEDINAQGNLIVTRPNGQQEILSSGEISIRL